MKSLNQLKIGQAALVHSLEIQRDSDLAIRLTHLGFLESSLVIILKRSIYAGGSFLVSVRGAQIALTKNEANMIKVTLCL